MGLRHGYFKTDFTFYATIYPVSTELQTVRAIMIM